MLPAPCISNSALLSPSCEVIRPYSVQEIGKAIYISFRIKCKFLFISIGVHVLNTKIGKILIFIEFIMDLFPLNEGADIKRF